MTQVLINELDAQKTAERISDSITRNLVMFAIAEARMRAIRRVGQSETEWRLSLPEQPFDMEFYVSVVASLFSKTDIVRAVLEGQDLAQASGWDV